MLVLCSALTVCARPQISVKGMTCSSCSSAVEKSLKALPGVNAVSVSLLAESAEVMAASSISLCSKT